MLDRIAELRAAGRGRGRRRRRTRAALEDVRVRFLGRKAELPNLLRGVAAAAAGGARRRRPRRQRGAPGARGRDRRPPRASSRPRELETRLAADVIDVTLPGAPVAADRPPAPDHRHAARDRGRVPRPRLPRRRGAGDRARLLQLRRAQPHAAAPGAAGVATRSTSPTTWCCARTRRRCRSARWSSTRRRSTSSSPAAPTGATATRTHTPQFHQIEGLAVDEDITLARPPGHAARVRPRDLRRRAPTSACGRTSSRSPSRASSSTSPASTARDGFLRDGSRCPLCKGEGWIELLGAGEVDPNVFEYVREHGYDPERHQGFASAWGSSGSPCSSTACPTCGCSTRTTSASWSSSDEAADPLAPRLRATPTSTCATLEERLTMTGTKVEAVHRHGVGALEHFRVGRVLTAERHPDADRLTVCTVDVGDRASRTRSSAARPTSPPARSSPSPRPGAVMPDGTRLKKAKLRGQESDGMILAEDEVAIGTEHDGIMVLDGRLGAGHAAGRRAPDRHRRARARDHAEPAGLPRRLRRRARGPRRHRRAARPAAVERRTPARPARWPARAVDVEAPDLCPRFTARLFEDVTIGPSPAWLKARLMAAGQRPINNVVDITNYAMLLTGQPLHAFDFDLVAGGRLVVRRAREGETDDHARRRRARARPATCCVICDDDGPTSIAGVMGGERSEVRRHDDARADGGRQLGRPEPPAHLDAARAAHRGVRPLREAARARAGDGRADRRDAADARADRRAAGRRHDRRRRAGSGAGGDPAARRAHRARCSAPPIPREEAARILERARVRRRRAPRTGSTSPSRRSAATTSRARPT